MGDRGTSRANAPRTPRTASIELPPRSRPEEQLLAASTVPKKVGTKTSPEPALSSTTPTSFEFEGDLQSSLEGISHVGAQAGEENEGLVTADASFAANKV